MADKHRYNTVPFRNRALSITKEFIDYRIGFAGAVVMGSIVFYINYHETQELTGAIIASVKQAVYTFLFGGTIMKICEHLAVRIKSKAMAILAAIIIPSIISIGLTFGVHNLKGTPKPFESTIPTAIFVIPSTAIWGIRKRNKIT